MGLDLDLPSQLVLDARLAQLRLVEHLERDDEVRLLLARQVDFAKLAVAERLADVEVTERPLAQLLLLRAVALRTGWAAAVVGSSALATTGRGRRRGGWPECQDAGDRSSRGGCSRDSSNACLGGGVLALAAARAAPHGAIAAPATPRRLASALELGRSGRGGTRTEACCWRSTLVLPSDALTLRPDRPDVTSPTDAAIVAGRTQRERGPERETPTPKDRERPEVKSLFLRAV